jgi:hypothetical protein
MPTHSAAAVLPAVRGIFRALAVTIVPEATRLDHHEWAELEAIVERALAERPPAVRRQIIMFLRFVDLLPLARRGRRFTALDPAGRTRLLLALQRSRVLPLRRGMWGIRTLIFLGFYARPSAAAEIGYRAEPRSWDARR